MNRKKIINLAISFLSLNLIFAFEKIPTQTLLSSWLENDADLKAIAIKLEKARLSQNLTSLENGFDITLSTGTMTLKTTGKGAEFSVKPSVKMSIPEAGNMGITVGTTITAGTNSSVDINSESFFIKDTTINMSADIISSAKQKREIQQIRAERSVTETERSLHNQALSSEKNFYSSLKSLLQASESLVSKQSDLYDATINFDKIKAQGYSKTSSTYRLADMKVQNVQHEIDSLNHSLRHDYRVFYKKCGYDIKLEDNLDFISLLPDDIPVVEPLLINSYFPDTYTETESAIWTYKINSMERAADKFFTLAANGGATFNNSNTKSHTLDAGLTASIGGASVTAGVNVPVFADYDKTGPAFSLSASVSPNSFKKKEIEKQQDLLDEQSEILAIKKARQNLGTKIVSQIDSLNDINWAKSTDTSSYEMYSKLEKDLYNWYRQGIITKSEYLSAQVSAQNYKIKLIIDDINLIIYNNEIQLMFVTDGKAAALDSRQMEKTDSEQNADGWNKETQE